MLTLDAMQMSCGMCGIDHHLGLGLIVASGWLGFVVACWGARWLHNRLA